MKINKRILLRTVALQCLVFSTVFSKAQFTDWQYGEYASGTGNAKGFSITVNGGIYVAGTFDSTSVTFGSHTIFGAGGNDIFLAEYDYAGNILWAKSFGGDNADIAYGLTSDGSGNIYMTGSFESDSIDFGACDMNIV